MLKSTKHQLHQRKTLTGGRDLLAVDGETRVACEVLIAHIEVVLAGAGASRHVLLPQLLLQVAEVHSRFVDVEVEGGLILQVL